MRKLSLLLAGFALATVSAFAQPKKPANPTFLTLDAAKNAEEIALYNVEAGMFLTGGNAWGTCASVVTDASSSGNGGHSTPMSSLYNGTAWLNAATFNLEDSEVTSVEGTAFYSLALKTNNLNKGGYLAPLSTGGVYIDGNKGANAATTWDLWTVTPLADNAFQLGYYVRSGSEDAYTYTKADQILGIPDLDAGQSVVNIGKGISYTTWAFVSADDAADEELLNKLTLYQLQKKLYSDVVVLEAVDKAAGKETDWTETKQLASKEYDEDTYEADCAALRKAIAAIPTTILPLAEAIKELMELDPSHDNSALLKVYAAENPTNDEITEAIAKAKAYVSLKKALDAAKAEYSDLDFSESEGVYKNADATAKELAEAEAKIQLIIDNKTAGNATVENPLDFTHYIKNATFDVVGNFDGWSGTAFGAGGDHKSTCAEHYNKNYDTYQDVNGGFDIPNGVYRVGVYAFYRAGSIANDWKTKDDPSVRNAVLYTKSDKITFNVPLPSLSSWATDQTEIGVLLSSQADITDEVGTLRVPDTMKDFTDYEDAGLGKEVHIYAMVTDGKMRLGVKKDKQIGADWTIADNFSLKFLGTSDAAYQLARPDIITGVESKFVSVDFEKELYTKSLKTVYDNAKSALEAATAVNDIVEQANTLCDVADKLLANIDAWKAYQAQVKICMENSIYDDIEKTGDLVEKFRSYFASGNEEPTGGAHNYPNGSYAYIIKNMSLSTEAIEKEIEFIKSLLSSAINGSLTPGSDASDLLTNPKFNKGFEGWVKEDGTPVKTGDGYNVGGITRFPAVEVYRKPVDVRQTVTVPNGLYAISCNAFQRTDSPYKEVVKLFMNDMETTVMNRSADIISIEDAVEFENCYLTKGAVKDGDTKYNDGGSDGADSEVGGGYVPNGMIGASYAFAYGRYEQTVYGVVENGELTVGLTSHGETPDWVLWSNFTLTYRGGADDPEVIASVLEELLDEYRDARSELEDFLTGEVYDRIDYLEDLVDELTEAGDTEAMLELIKDLRNKYIEELKVNAEACQKFLQAYEELSGVYAEYAETASDEAKEAYNEVKDLVNSEDYYDLQTDELLKWVEDMKLIIAKLKALPVPKGWENASDDEPFDMSAIIANNDFEQNTFVDFQGTMPGWTWEKNGGNGPTIEKGVVGQSCEIWNGTAANLKFNMHQLLFNLPAGKYELKVNAANSLDGEKSNGEKGRAALYAITSGGVTASTPIEVTTLNAVEAARGTDNAGEPVDYNPVYSIFFTATGEEDETVEVGLQTVGTMEARWFVCDNVKLIYYGKDSEKADSDDDALVDIEGITAEAPAIEAIYTVAGAKVATLQKGINIVKYADGKVVKVLVK